MYGLGIVSPELFAICLAQNADPSNPAEWARRNALCTANWDTPVAAAVVPPVAVLPPAPVAISPAAPAPVAAVILPSSSSFDFASIPWWGWAGVAVALFAMKGGR